MSRRGQARARGTGSATGAGAADLRLWWAKSAPRPDRTVVAVPPSVQRDASRLDMVAAAAAVIQRASDEHEVFAAVAEAIELHGLSGHLAALDPTGLFLTVHRASLPWAHQAELERLHGGPMVGARIEIGTGGAHWSVLHQRCSMHAPEPLGWVLGAAADIGPADSDAIAAFVGLGEALLVPITDERDVFGVLTLWAPTLGSSDRMFAEILGRIAGGALSAQRARHGAWQNPPARAA